jgi:hypothetical protein
MAFTGYTLFIYTNGLKALLAVFLLVMAGRAILPGNICTCAALKMFAHTHSAAYCYIMVYLQENLNR